MKFGQTVTIIRSSIKEDTIHFRSVKATYLGARKGAVYCKLIEDDSISSAFPGLAGQSAWFPATSLSIQDSK